LSKIPIAFIEIRLFAHATEDSNKVTEAVKQIFPTGYTEEVEFKRTDLKGHYGNPITLFETKIKEGKTIRAFIDSLFSRLSAMDKENLLREISLHVERGSLYLRLDKQAALCREIKLCMRDPIRVRIRFRKGGIEEILKVCKEFGMLP
jgi:hypothetical protein